MAISHWGYITKFQTRRETLILCHWRGLSQNSFGLNFCHLMIYFFKMAKIKECFLGFLVAKFQKKQKNDQITYQAIIYV